MNTSQSVKLSVRALLLVLLPTLLLALSSPKLMIMTESPLPAGTVGAHYSQPLTLGGGTHPYVWSVKSGTLPAGVKLAATGTLAGTPSVAGASSFTLQVADSKTHTAFKAFTLTVKQ